MSALGIVLSLDRIEDTVTAARLAEQAGFESVWTTEFPDHSATVPLAAVAPATDRVTLGTAIAYAFGRTPLVLAAEARDLDSLSNGRLILGLGTGTQRMQREWHGLDGEHPAPRMEELVPLLRSLLRLDEGPLEHEGRFYRTIVHPTAPVPPPLRAKLPIFMAGVNARMIEAAGAVADGLVGHPLFTQEYTRDVVRVALARGAERAGRPQPPPVAGYVTCVVNEDGDAARAAARARDWDAGRPRASPPHQSRARFALGARRAATWRSRWEAWRRRLRRRTGDPRRPSRRQTGRDFRRRNPRPGRRCGTSRARGRASVPRSHAHRRAEGPGRSGGPWSGCARPGQ